MFISILLQGSAVFFSFAASWYIARHLGAAQYGLYAYIFQWAAMLVGLIVAMYDKLLLRQTAIYTQQQDINKQKGIVNFSLGIHIICLIAALLVGMLVAQNQAFSPEITYCLLLSILFSSFIAFCQNYLTGTGNTTAARMPDLLVRPAVLCLLLAITNLSLSQIGHLSFAQIPLLFIAAYCNTAAMAIAFVVALYYGLRAYLPTFKTPKIAKYDWATWLPAIPWLCLSGIVAIVNARADILLLGLISGDNAEIGIYQIALRLADLLKIPLIALNAIIAPQIAALHNQNQTADLQTFIKSKARLTMLASSAMALILIGLGIPLLSWWGSDFSGAYIPLCLLCIGQLFNVACGPVGNLLNMTGNIKQSFMALSAATLLSIVLQCVLTPIWGAIGTALAAMMGIILSNILMVYFSAKRVHINATIF